MSLDGLRTGAEAFLRGPGGGGRRGTRSVSWKQRFDVPMKDAADARDISEPCIFINAEYDDPYQPGVKRPYYHYRVHHFNQGTKNYREIVCSAGPDGRGECYGCHMYSQGNKWAEPKDKVSFNIAHLGWYHDTPLLDSKTGQPIMKREDPTQYIIIRTPCEAQGNNFQCKWCGAGYQRAYGGHRYLEVGPGHFESIQGMDKALQGTCVNCHTSVLIPETSYRCPDCKEVAYEIATSGFTTQEQVQQYNLSHQPCRKCGSVKPFEPAYECGYVKGVKMGGGCAPGQTKVATLFDTVVYLFREKGKLVTLKGDVKVPFSNFRAPEGGRTPEAVLEEIKVPFDFSNLYKPDSVAEQCKQVGAQNPFGPAAPSYQPYPGPAAWQQPGQSQTAVPPPQGMAPPMQGQPQQWQQPNQVPPPPPPSPGVPGMPPRPFGR